MRFLLALLLIAAAPADTAPAVRVTLTTAQGPITIEVDRAHAPVTAANFLRYVDQKWLDGTVFYRAMKAGAGVGLIQGGTRQDAKRTLPPIKHEPTTQTGLSHTDGAISMARFAPGTANGDFFIIVGDMRGLDAQPSMGGDNAGFAVFGRVVGGMDVVKAILAAPTDPAKGDGAMKGQMLGQPVRIVTARRVAVTP